MVALGGLALVLVLQRMGIGKAYAYVVPGAIVWFGLLKTGVHPTLAGVILGLMTPVNSKPATERPLETIGRTFHELKNRFFSGQRQSAGRRRTTQAIAPRATRSAKCCHPFSESRLGCTRGYLLASCPCSHRLTPR